MNILIKGIEIPEDNTVLLRIYPESEGVFYVEQLDIDDDILDRYWAVPVPDMTQVDLNVFIEGKVKTFDIPKPMDVDPDVEKEGEG